MIDVGEKPATKRRALAHGRIRMNRDAFNTICYRSNPKGDVLAQAEVAGILASKRASEMIPLCHPLPLDQVLVSFELDEDSLSVVASCEASSTAKTGVEMEALCGVSGALLAIYDLAKAVDPALTITDIHVSVKEGGKSGRWVNPAPPTNWNEPSGAVQLTERKDWDPGPDLHPIRARRRGTPFSPFDVSPPVERDEETVDRIRVRVQLFGVFRKFSKGDDVSFEVPRGATVSVVREQLMEALRRECPSWDAHDLVRSSVLAAESQILEDSQEVGCGAGEVVLAILPPVCGGSR